MNKLSDEILNKLIDGELPLDEVKEVMKILNESSEDNDRYQTLLNLHGELKDLKEETTSDSFTYSVMKRIQAKYQVRKSDKFFIFSISSIFVILLLGLIGYVVSSVATSGQSSTGEVVVNNLVSFTQTFVEFSTKLFSKSALPVVGSVISAVMLGIAYFFYENLRHMKQKLSKLRS